MATTKNQPWQGKLELNPKTGAPVRKLLNALLVVESDPAFQGAILFNNLRYQATVMRPMPWDKINGVWEPREWADADDAELAIWMQSNGLNFPTALVAEAVQIVARRNHYHPIKDYFARIVWDGEHRLETMAVDYFGADDTPYNRTIMLKWMISGVARVYRPGQAKVDCMIVLEGPQGIYKSTALSVIGDPCGAGSFTDSISAFDTRHAAEEVRGVWLIEISELDAVRRAADVSMVKSFLSKTSDRYRPPYGRNVQNFPRQCFFGGSTNSNSWNRDDTGGRRFWPLVCGIISIEALRANIDQLWAEAYTRYLTGEPWWLEDAKIIATAKEMVEERQPEDPWSDKVGRIVDDFTRIVPGTETTRPVAFGAAAWVTTEQILREVGVETGKFNLGDSQRVATVLRKKGWQRKLVRVGTDRQWRYLRPKEVSSGHQV
jgi:putative DNA primase/helicase